MKIETRATARQKSMRGSRGKGADNSFAVIFIAFVRLVGPMHLWPHAGILPAGRVWTLQRVRLNWVSARNCGVLPPVPATASAPRAACKDRRVPHNRRPQPPQEPD